MKAAADDIRQLHRQAQAAMASGDLRRAHQLCLTLLKLDPKHADAWFLCGVIAASNGLRDKAIEIIRRAVGLAPDIAEYRAELGKMLLAAGELELALEEAGRAYDLAPTTATTLNTLGTLLSHCGEHERALACFEQAASLVAQGKAPEADSWRADFHFNWAAALRIAGRFEDTADQLERTLALDPVNFRAHLALSSLQKQTPQANHIDRLEDLQAQVRNPRDQLNLGHALAKEEEDLGHYDRAMQHLQWAKSAQKEAIGYDFSADRQLFEHIKSLFDAKWQTQAEGDCDSAEPIFIVGMPRTGTTLVEQILSSHSQVFAAGELQNFPIQLRRWAGAPPGATLDSDTLAAAAATPVTGLGQRYLDSTRPRTGHSAHFIDKLPLNFLIAGLIQKALPRAKLVCLRRDPMDTCLSNYRQLFALNFPYYRYNLDLLDCGRYYIGFDDLMRHWESTMPGKVYNIVYEDVVADTENESRRLLEFCGLDWEDQCLDFHNRQTSVATPSAVQVRQGIYSSSVERWRRYGDAMEPLYTLLSDAGFYD